MLDLPQLQSTMPDITQHEAIPTVERRLEGQSQGGGRSPSHGQPSKKVAASYQEVARVKPVDDRVTILGIPVEQITPVTQAALAGLVGEINHLRNVVKRYERSQEKRPAGQSNPETAVLEHEAFMRTLGPTLNQPPGDGATWVLVLVHVSTYEDIRRSSGLLAANGTLADVAHRLRDVRLVTEVPAPAMPQKASTAQETPATAAVSTVPFVLLGHVGGSNLAAVTAVSQESLDTAAIAKTVREHLGAAGYVVGGIDMALAISVAAAAVGAGESPLLAIGRTDHILRTS